MAATVTPHSLLAVVLGKLLMADESPSLHLYSPPHETAQPIQYSTVVTDVIRLCSVIMMLIATDCGTN